MAWDMSVWSDIEVSREGGGGSGSGAAVLGAADAPHWWRAWVSLYAFLLMLLGIYFIFTKKKWDRIVKVDRRDLSEWKQAGILSLIL